TSDIINALIGLGYTDREARAAVKKLPDDVSVSDGIRMALQNIVK
ncbi:MAG TPA: Holliday junction branch migration protein RuvA, partial [Candidatus Aphodousia faecipullorum]|nr:Holliday junction branch migration protein RuvA [Candidatus Aphodousia faecipullorum]